MCHFAMGLTHYDKTTSILCKGVIFAYFHSEGNSLALKELSNINFNGYAISFAVSNSILE